MHESLARAKFLATVTNRRTPVKEHPVTTVGHRAVEVVCSVIAFALLCAGVIVW